MEQQIQDLIASIKKDGIEQAKAESDRILNEAKAKAEDIIRKAEEEKNKLLEDAKHRIDLEKSSAEALIKQAARDVSISLKKEIEARFKSILERGVASDMHTDVLAKCLEGAIKSDLNSSDIFIELSKDDFSALSESLSAKFSKEIADGLEFKISDSVQEGFRIVQKNGEAYIDLSPESCTELLMPYLSDSLKGIL